MRGQTRSDLHLNRSTSAIDVDPTEGTVILDGPVLKVDPDTEGR